MKQVTITLIVLTLTTSVLTLISPPTLYSQEANNGALPGITKDADPAVDGQSAPAGIPWGIVLAILGAAVSTAGGGFGSSVGVGIAGEVGNGVLSEDEKKFGPVLLLQALPATQGIYGMLIAFIILGKISPALSLSDGFGILFAAFPVAISCLISGIWQGKVSAASMQLIARKPKQMGQAVILPAMVETFAVFGLLVSILMMGQVGT